MPEVSKRRVLDCRNIRIADGRIQEIGGGRALVSLPLAEIKDVRLVRDIVAERPVVQAVVGAVVTALGVAWALRILYWLFRGGVMWDVEVLMLGGLIGGPLFIRGALRRGLVLKVEMANDTRKIGLDKKI